ncbi:hypothetical protein KBX71_19450 [Micromonospora sp. D93]|uniref:hypothetical protein n=1 Tax=Micromonospora sp. D93 TaxID=2824886 RepID=UPI001B3593EF|nr:hypothetical protein [Micromonospora sp. D93]MBQ1020024.1 hypothetical protein [Micromonospora sp. D93]
MVLALLLGLAAGWLLRGRRGVQGNSIVDGDPVAGLAVITTPTPAATTDEARPAAAVDSAPTAVADEPAPVDTVSAPAALTEPDGPTPLPVPADAPSTVDPAEMALTEDPPPVPVTEQSDGAELQPEPTVESASEPVTVDEKPVPAAVVAPRQPADDLPTVDTEQLDTTPADGAPDSVGLVDDSETKATTADAMPADALATADPTDAEPVHIDSVNTEPVQANSVNAEPVDAESAVDAAGAERSAMATPPVRPATAATPPVRSAADAAISGVDANPTGPADDFRRIQGIGPKMAAALQDAGVRTYGELGELDEPALRDLIRAAGLRAAPGLASWPQQARVLAGAGEEMAAVLPNSNQA